MSPVGDGWELPPGAEPWSDFHWFQASTKGVLEIVVLSSGPSWYTGHYVGGRMSPCAGSGCELCAAGIGAQVRFVFAIVEIQTRRVGLIELGRGNGQQIRDWTARAGGLRGMRLEVSKHSRNAQSRTEVRYVEEVCPPWYLGVPVPDVQLALYLTWHKAGMVIPPAFADLMSGKLQQAASGGQKMLLSEVNEEAARFLRSKTPRG
jgi:hypothetical protein